MGSARYRRRRRLRRGAADAFLNQNEYGRCRQSRGKPDAAESCRTQRRQVAKRSGRKWKLSSADPFWFRPVFLSAHSEVIATTKSRIREQIVGFCREPALPAERTLTASACFKNRGMQYKSQRKLTSNQFLFGVSLFNQSVRFEQVMVAARKDPAQLIAVFSSASAGNPFQVSVARIFTETLAQSAVTNPSLVIFRTPPPGPGNRYCAMRAADGGCQRTCCGWRAGAVRWRPATSVGETPSGEPGQAPARSPQPTR